MTKRMRNAATRGSSSKAQKQLQKIRHWPPRDDHEFLTARLPIGRVTYPRSAYPHPLDALNPTFCEALKWRAPDHSGSEDVDAYLATSIAMIRPTPELHLLGGRRVVAVDGRMFDLANELTTLNDEWGHLINVRAPTAEFADAGRQIWQRSGIIVPQERTAYMMQMEAIDEDTSAAVQAALFMTAHSTAGLVDMEAISFAVCSFIHAHPYFDRMIQRSRLPLPYGDRTAYVPIGR